MAFEICVLCVCFVFPFESRATFMDICICILWCAYILVHMFGIIFQFEFNAYFRDTACGAFPFFFFSLSYSHAPVNFSLFLIVIVTVCVCAIDTVTDKHVSISILLHRERSFAIYAYHIYSYYNHS